MEPEWSELEVGRPRSNAQKKAAAIITFCEEQVTFVRLRVCVCICVDCINQSHPVLIYISCYEWTNVILYVKMCILYPFVTLFVCWLILLFGWILLCTFCIISHEWIDNFYTRCSKVPITISSTMQTLSYRLLVDLF